MFRKSALALAMLGACASTHVVALGLGEIELNSALNQPLDAEIELLSATDAELQELKVNIGSADAFNNAGIERPLFLNKLKFDVNRTSDGRAVVRVTSRDVVREPFLDFLLEISWSKGRLLREYTVLVDPPVTMPAPAPVTQAPVQAAPQPAAAPPPVAPQTRTVRHTGQFPPVSVSPGEYGPTKRNDTLWNIASQVRPDTGISVEQTMLGLQRANPEAFTDNNINNLKAGYVLRVPSREELNSISRGEAVREARAQYQTWKAARSGAATPVTAEAPAPVAESAPVVAAGSEASPAESSLQLVAPEEGAGTAAAGDGSLQEVQRELLMANEALEEQRRQGEETANRLSVLEEQIINMQRLIQLKDDELARLQTQTAGEGSDAAAVAETLEPVEAAAEESLAVEGETVAAPDNGVAAEGESVVEEALVAEAPVEEAAGSQAVESAVPAEGEAIVAEDAAIEETPAEGAVVEEAVVEETVAEETLVEEAAVAPVEPAPAEPVAPTTATPPGFVERLLDNPVWLGAGGVVLALLAFFGLRRKRGVETEFQESILQAAQEDSAIADSEIVQGAADSSESKTPESSLLSEFAVSDMGSLKGDGEADPLAEADVYLAYGRFQQAEDLIKEALEKDSDRDDLNLKLLEVYLAGKNEAAFDEHAQAMLARLENTTSPVWAKVAEMGREMNPDNPLYQAEGESGSAEDSDDIEALSEDLDFSMGDEAPAESPEANNADTGEDEGLDFDIDLSYEESKEDAPDSVEFTPPEVDESEAQKIDANMDTVEPDAVSQDSPMDIDLENFDIDTSELGDEEEAQGDGELADLDEVSTKLDLARAYIDMGDPDGARSILDEVMEEGSEEQKEEAREILGQMA